VKLGVSLAHFVQYINYCACYTGSVELRKQMGSVAPNVHKKIEDVRLTAAYFIGCVMWKRATDKK
jgi:capsule polysaccharide export protein KpsC/LpsZ